MHKYLIWTFAIALSVVAGPEAWGQAGTSRGQSKVQVKQDSIALGKSGAKAEGKSELNMGFSSSEHLRARVVHNKYRARYDTLFTLTQEYWHKAQEAGRVHDWGRERMYLDSLHVMRVRAGMLRDDERLEVIDSLMTNKSP